MPDEATRAPAPSSDHDSDTNPSWAQDNILYMPGQPRSPEPETDQSHSTRAQDAEEGKAEEADAEEGDAKKGDSNDGIIDDDLDVDLWTNSTKPPLDIKKIGDTLPSLRLNPLMVRLCLMRW